MAQNDHNPATADAAAPEEETRRARRWKPGWLTIVIALLGVGGLVAGLYPMTAAWVTSYNQSRVIENYETAVQHATPDAAAQLREAAAYNDALTAGVVLSKNANVPVGDGTLASELDYRSILSANAEGLMARVKIPRIDVDLPVFHGTTDDVLNKGAGHLEGSHLPIGGESTRSVITAHRGLANATMFTNLNEVVEGDLITIETFGKVLTYRVRDIQVIEPDANGTIRPEKGEDLLTLITCTPLGINTHRIVVTGERVTPTPDSELKAAGAVPTIPGFPWWAVIGGGGLLLITGYVGWQGFLDAGQTRRSGRAARATHERKDPGTATAARRGEENDD